MIFCGNPSRNWLPHIEFNEFHISFHNLEQIFRELRSHARKEFRVCLKLCKQLCIQIYLQPPFIVTHYVYCIISGQRTHSVMTNTIFFCPYIFIIQPQHTPNQTLAFLLALFLSEMVKYFFHRACKSPLWDFSI